MPNKQDIYRPIEKANETDCMNRSLFFICLLCGFTASAQRVCTGVVLDSLTKKPLPFSTVSAGEKNTVISEIDGQFSIALNNNSQQLSISYVAHRTKLVSVEALRSGDTILLSPAGGVMNEVVIRSQFDKIRRIVNLAVKNKTLNNPERLDHYECNIYYKMNADLVSMGIPDTTGPFVPAINDSTKEERAFFSGEKHLIFSESYSKRIYKKPQQLQEIVLASRFSGLKKTYFTNVVTDILPFHVYTDYINLNGTDYVNPIARGWQQRYRFLLTDELLVGGDTVFLLSFEPRKKGSFNSLTGAVYINSNGYAISHFISSTGDSTKDRQIKFEQIYSQVNGKWFPRELNYDLVIRNMMSSYMQLIWNGHSVIDSVRINQPLSLRIDKAYPVKMGDSIDLHSEKDWEGYRKDSITQKEKNTYQFMDSLVEEHHLDKLAEIAGPLAVGKFPVGKFDIDINRILSTNRYENFRLGLGLYTNDRVSRYYSVGGWFGYGTKDKVWKYGGSAAIFFGGNKENTLNISYQKNYRSPGESFIHPELQQKSFRNALLRMVDQFEETSVTLSLRLGYWELRPEVKKEMVRPLYESDFMVNGKRLNRFTAYEAGVGFRYAYGEKRYPAFGYYLSDGTKYPIFYLRLLMGQLSSGDFEANYLRALAAVTYTHHLNRWGNDRIRLEGGMIHTFQDEPLPPSFLLAGRGLKVNDINNYTEGGFLTMRPFGFYNDSYVSFFYKHEFDWFLWDTKWSKPFIGLAHNLGYGWLNARNRAATGFIQSMKNGYHESGFMLNQLLRLNLHFGEVNLNGGVFYHWNHGWKWKDNNSWVLGLSFGF